MANIRAKAQVNQVTRGTSDDVFVNARSTRDGAIFGADWLQGLIMEGRGFMIQVGALTTGILGGGAGTVLDLDQPEFNISIPSGTCILPIRIHVQCEVPADTDADIQEIVIGYDKLAVWAGGTYTSETVYNMRTAASRTSLCTANSAFTVNQTTEPTVIELARAQTVTNILTSGITNKQFELLYEPKQPPIIVGPAQLLGYFGGVSAMYGFAQVFWVELPTTAFS